MKVSKERLKSLRRAARSFFAEAQTYSDLQQCKFARSAGIGERTMVTVFHRKLWARMRHKWARKKIRPKMKEVFAASVTRKDFLVEKIIDDTGITKATFHRALGEEYRSLRASLLTGPEVVLRTIDRMIEEGSPITEFTKKKVFRTAGVSPEAGPWLYNALRRAILKLKRRGSRKEAVPPEGIEAREVPGGFVNLDDVVWDLGIGHGLIRKDRLRQDFAEIAWSHLISELRARRLQLSTVQNHYLDFITVAECLGDKIRDVRESTLADVQQAWTLFAKRSSKLQCARWALLQIYYTLICQSEEDRTLNRSEMIAIFVWLKELKASAKVPSDNFLSASELDSVVDGCLKDIQDGMRFAEETPAWASFSTKPNGRENAAAVSSWGYALVILLLSFTGLRRQSALRLRLGDWRELRPEVFAVAWRHIKKKEEKVALMPDVLAKLLEDYVRYTANLREMLGTDLVFLGGDHFGNWQPLNPEVLLKRMSDFVRRYRILRDEAPIDLTPMVLRRTYATRELYDGNNIWLLRIQLGHDSLRTTLKYIKFDRFEHPQYVSGPLDAWGRNVLGPWHTPRLLDELSEEERADITSGGESRRVEGGVCRNASCVKAKAGSPPPCTLCEHLVTGAEFLDEWQSLRAEREGEIEALKRDDPGGHLVAQRRFQLELFKSNQQFIINSTKGGVAGER